MLKHHINKLKERPEKIRKQYVSIALVFCMTIVVSIWVWGISYKISSINREKEVVKEETSTTAKPFSLLLGTAKNAYDNVKASVGDASVSLDNIKKEKEEEKSSEDNGKVIDLIPVEYIQQ